MAVSFRIQERVAVLLAVVFLVVLPLAGLAPLVVPDGTAAFAEGSPEREMAERALGAAELHLDHPLQRLAYPGMRVREVRSVPDHCDRVLEGEARRHADLAASVTLITWFGLPAGRVTVTCGGAGPWGSMPMPEPGPPVRRAFGRWAVTGWTCPDASCALDPEEGDAFLGREATYGSGFAGFHDTRCQQARLRGTIQTAAAWAEEVGVDPQALEAPEGEVLAAEVRCGGEAWPWPGGRIAVVEGGRMMVPWMGALFHLEPLPTPQEEGIPEGCVPVRTPEPTVVAFFAPPEGEDEMVPPSLLEQVELFRATLVGLRPQLEERGVRLVEFYRPCMYLLWGGPTETVRTDTRRGMGFVVRGNGKHQIFGVGTPVEDVLAAVDRPAATIN